MLLGFGSAETSMAVKRCFALPLTRKHRINRGVARDKGVVKAWKAPKIGAPRAQIDWPNDWPGWRIGIRSRLKIDGLKQASGFKSHPGQRCRPSNRAAAMSTESTEAAPDTATYHGGRLIARRLKAHGVSHLFTLSG